MVEEPTTVTKLKDKWTWAYKPTIVYKPQSAADWMSDYRQAIPRTFDTAEEFWAIYQHLPKLPKLDMGNIYAVFKEGVQPTWEHPRNEHGYSIVFYPNKNNSDDYIERLYEASLLLLMSGAGGASMNGCTFERKTAGNKIVFWMAQCPPGGQAAQLNMVKSVLQLLEVPKNETTLTDNAPRIDWKEPRFADFKIAIRCVSHKKRANEPPPQRRTLSGGGSGGRRGSTRWNAGGGAGRGAGRGAHRNSSRQSTNHHPRQRGSGGSGGPPPSRTDERDRYTRK